MGGILAPHFGHFVAVIPAGDGSLTSKLALQAGQVAVWLSIGHQWQMDENRHILPRDCSGFNGLSGHCVRGSNLTVFQRLRYHFTPERLFEWDILDLGA